jgi:hypothetical protein
LLNYFLYLGARKEQVLAEEVPLVDKRLDQQSQAELALENRVTRLCHKEKRS